MFDFLALITKKRYWLLHSILMKWVMRCYGIRVGRNFYIEGVPKLKVRGRGGDIRIGDDVSIFGPIDLRNRERGSIIIEDGAAIDNDCRFVAANDAVLRIGKRTGIGPYCIFNAGVDISVGEDCLLAGMIYVQSSQHGLARGELVRKQKHTYGRISIGNDVWIAANAAVTKGAVVGDGCVIGAKALVREGTYEPYSILAGTPAVKVKDRV
ncbi:MAG: acyltransferase [Elusimicrobiota bacterium]|jgi:acetyltransferase-like isoleucine patch superfamily enzyme